MQAGGQPQAGDPHRADPVGGVGHQVGVPPHGGGRRYQSHVWEAGGGVGEGEPWVGEGEPGEGFGLARGVENVGCLGSTGRKEEQGAQRARGEAVSSPHILFNCTIDLGVPSLTLQLPR